MLKAGASQDVRPQSSTNLNTSFGAQSALTPDLESRLQINSRGFVSDIFNKFNNLCFLLNLAAQKHGEEGLMMARLAARIEEMPTKKMYWTYVCERLHQLHLEDQVKPEAVIMRARYSPRRFSNLARQIKELGISPNDDYFAADTQEKCTKLARLVTRAGRYIYGRELWRQMDGDRNVEECVHPCDSTERPHRRHSSKPAHN